MRGIDRRSFVAGASAVALAGCSRAADWCGEDEQWTDDGAFPYPDACPPTADDIEGPFYRAGAPERTDLTGVDEGTVVELSGRVYDGACDRPLGGAVVEFWQADPKGRYDDSDEMSYRCRVTTDAEGAWSLRTLLPGRYLNGATFRPRHVHVKVLGPDGAERLTTQLYFAGDPYNECDPYVTTSLVVPFAGDEASGMSATDVHFVLA